MLLKKQSGFIEAFKKNAQGKPYFGRFVCPDVQWTESVNQSFCTFTVTAGQLADAAESGLLWTDQDVQRGIQPGANPSPARELSLAQGYPPSSHYIFNSENADDMVDKLLRGETLFLNPLIWNLRPTTFEAFWHEGNREIYLYKGKIYLPDSHHRHQAIIKAVNIWRDAPKDYPKFNEDLQFKIELYFLSREDEGNYFYDKNQRPKPTAKSKAYDLTTQDDLSLLAKKVIENSGNLAENVNRVTDRLDSRNPQVITLSTLREMMRTFASADAIDASELDGMAAIAANFYDMLATVRPELGKLPLLDRRAVRNNSLVDAAVMMQGYAHLMREYNLDFARKGPTVARETWSRKLEVLSDANVYVMRGWSGDLFEKRNPLWEEVGVTRGNTTGKITVLNTGAARSQAGRVLRQLVQVNPPPSDLTFLAAR
ncbi:DNA sulfur modification protein DndB [Sinorhizobium meliloti]|uniref:DNA sulfur modification protein DndB n=1 Tax=Rhizobium meliloti TaxID=382 RepID=UPI0012FDB351|nr:DNA sulfur modification protein DndB [Sinorhizobium meliloti]MDE3858117.1 hypothetical protein [Sinorhizobium meliloti]